MLGETKALCAIRPTPGLPGELRSTKLRFAALRAIRLRSSYKGHTVDALAQEPKKDVVSCEKPRGAANRQRSGDIRMGKPT
jgi:hypothetical protein